MKPLKSDGQKGIMQKNERQNMENIKYIVKRLKTIDWKKMYEKIRSINKKTGIPKIKGFQIPYWNEVIELCKKASKEIPEMGVYWLGYSDYTRRTTICRRKRISRT